MAFSLFLVGQASTIGLTNTSNNPPPTAYTATAINRPAKALLHISGRIVRKTNPVTAQRCAIIIDAL